MSPFQVELLELVERHRDEDLTNHRIVALFVVALALVDAFKLRYSDTAAATTEDEFLECARTGYRKARARPATSS